MSPRHRLHPTPPPKVRVCRPRRTRWVIGPTPGDPFAWRTCPIAPTLLRHMSNQLDGLAARGVDQRPRETAPVLTPCPSASLEMKACRQQEALKGFALRRNQYIFYGGTGATSGSGVLLPVLFVPTFWTCWCRAKNSFPANFFEKRHSRRSLDHFSEIVEP